MSSSFVAASVDSPLYLRPHAKSVLKTAITNDSMFLSRNLVMDYSLLVGLDEATKELVVGIIGKGCFTPLNIDHTEVRAASHL